jgi:hypothetical protein
MAAPRTSFLVEFSIYSINAESIPMQKHSLSVTLAALLLTVCSVQSQAATTFTDQTAFLTALPGPAGVLDLENGVRSFILHGSNNWRGLAQKDDGVISHSLLLCKSVCCSTVQVWVAVPERIRSNPQESQPKCHSCKRFAAITVIS